ncbi:hypothetical protein BHS04_18390 [Myxococcus xanthus]|nr:hypothetical protein BHS04_18390 [Myxococcus xanthus]
MLLVAMDLRDIIPDVRDGLSQAERVILHTLHQLQRERGGRSVPTVMLTSTFQDVLRMRPFWVPPAAMAMATRE